MPLVVEEQLVALTAKVGELDRDVAVVRTQLLGQNAELLEMKHDIKDAKHAAQENQERLTGMDAGAKARWQILVAIQLLVATGVALLSLAGRSG